MSEDMSDSVDTLLDTLGIEDPELRQYVGMEFRKNGTGKTISKTSRKRTSHLRERVECSENLVEVLMAKLEVLACALGACPACWGDDPDCEECGGMGKCGEFLPDQKCFETYVIPVLKQLQAGQNARSSPQIYREE